ncbi:MAG: TonB-dependent receptor plug domain-containing protein [Melioribacteraceae bacterium]|nr:TonB-dependent receptor plug domain-containing protein [Melioribacteraceae bacterium]MCF8265915.1 TonB-dependent receptor plug domain-containing protein [Melioribacteraceae bacterium]MCF8412559.1 TonB-dependent receptor plug domain-containing protein [Melioribacteraceae bacterium]MCF8431674.1 TonB-dependent receptor plug domain-containing protein [Melioribacteraceae bacterium]
MIVSYVGYIKKSLRIHVEPNKITQVDIPLAPSSYELQTIEKVGQRVAESNATDISLQRITVKELEDLPKGVETDVFRSLQYLPGVQSTGDVSARYYVRGGSADQNLVLLNGVTLYNPFHALGLFSAIDPEVINSIEFYKGGYSAEFGDRISSVLKINTKDGNKNNFAAKASSSFLTGKLLLEGPLPAGSFMITGRKSYSNDILKKFLNEQTVPADFYDMSFKANFSSPNLIKGAKVTFHGFFSGDKVSNGDPFKEDFEWKNNLFGFNWFQISDSPLFLELGLSFSDFKGEVIPNFSNVKPKLNKVEDVTFKTDFTYVYDSKDEFSVGVHVKDIETKLFLENSKGAVSNVGTHGTLLSFYAKYKFLRYENLGIDIGSRINLTGLSGAGDNTGGFEPRLSFTYRIIPEIAIKGAWGIYSQELSTVTDEDEVITIFEPWLINPFYLKPTQSRHYILGVQMQPYNFLQFNVEGYYKDIFSLPLLNDNKAFSTDNDFVAGKGESYGIEFMVRLTADPVRFTASYTNAYSYKEIDNWVYYPRYDVRHSANISLEYNWGWGVSSSLVWIYSSGLPFTQLSGFYDKYFIDDIYFDGNFYHNQIPISILDDKNLGRLPDYHRLDFNISKKFDFTFFRGSIDFSIINVYDRKNLFYFDKNTGERVNMLPFLPTATVKLEI